MQSTVPGRARLAAPQHQTGLLPRPRRARTNREAWFLPFADNIAVAFGGIVKKSGLVILACALLTSACASYDSSRVISTGDRYEPFSGAQDYLLGPGDKLGVNVFNEAGITGTYAVAPDGTVTLPLIGGIKAAGKTPSQIAQEAADRYRNGYLQLPSVSVQVLEYRPFFVLGEVNQAGQYAYVPGITALSAIAAARGFSARAERKVLFIRREGTAEESIYKIEPGLKIYPGDTIRVEERYF